MNDDLFIKSDEYHQVTLVPSKTTTYEQIHTDGKKLSISLPIPFDLPPVPYSSTGKDGFFFCVVE
jgi:hypothetical protein